jgi:FkbM family methyltransferase
VLTLPNGVVSFFTKHRSLGVMALKCVPDIRRRIDVDHIGPFVIRLRRNRSFWIRSPLATEGLMLGYLKRLIQPGDVVFDIGANVGLYTRFIAHFGAGQVFAFEPMSENVDLLRKNVALARSGRFEVMQMALSDKDGDELLQVDDVMSGTASLDRVRGGEASFGRKIYGLSPLTERVRVARLDTLVASGKLPPPQVMKIDVEGAEELVLEGASQVILEHRPALAIELHGSELAAAVITRLDRVGYCVFGYVREGKKVRYTRLKPEDAGLLGSYDHIVADTRPERIETPIEPFQ